MSTLDHILSLHATEYIDTGSEILTCADLLEQIQDTDPTDQNNDDDWGILDGYIYRGENKLSGYCFVDYFDLIQRHQHIQEWFGGYTPVPTQDQVVDGICEAYPLSDGVTREDVVEWVFAQVTAYNDECDDERHFLPTE